MRIAKYLASCGLGSRRYCEELIFIGKVKINEQLIETPAIEIDPAVDIIKVNEATVKPNQLVYYMLNKPVGYTTTRFDPHADKFITDLLPKEPPVWPIGRLDRETSGLILMTNDGDLTNKLTHPKYRKEKRYLIKLDAPLKNTEVQTIIDGLELEDGWLKPDSFRAIAGNTYEIVIHEGRKRLIRRLIAFFGRKVVSLERTRIDRLEIGNLKPGEYRTLNKNELEILLKDV